MPLTHLALLRQSLTQVQNNPAELTAFCLRARHQPVLLAALPQRYTSVWHDLLDRLESSALFTEESCSFSQIDLLDSVSIWLDKAQTLLQA
jgi:hypothetical protein